MRIKFRTKCNIYCKVITTSKFRFADKNGTRGVSNARVMVSGSSSPIGFWWNASD